MLLLVCALLAVDPRYHNYQETVDELRQLVTDYPTLCRLETLGYSTTNHWPILALKLSDHPAATEDEPRILYNGVHHACELIGNEICLYMAHDLLGRYGSDPNVTRWLDSNQIFLIPILNPDGHAINMADLDTIWRKNTHDFNQNGIFDPDSDGVDLNRNYDFLWQYGDPNQGSRYFRGFAPFSENETQVLRQLAEREKFIFDICWHSSINPGEGQTVYYPWRWGASWCPDYPETKTIAESIGRRIINDFGTGYYAALFGRADEGAVARNWLYHSLGTFAFTVEVSTRYQPPGYRVDSICQRVSLGAYYLLDRAHRSLVTGHIYDSLTRQPLIAEVKVLEATAGPDTIRPRLSDSLYGRYWRPLRPGTYTIEVSKYGYYPKTITGVVITPQQATVLDVPLVRNPEVEEYQYLRPARRPSGHPLRADSPIRYELPQASNIHLAVYDQSGRCLRLLVQGQQPAGDYAVTWNQLDDSGKPVAPGVYFAHLFSNNTNLTFKLVVP